MQPDGSLPDDNQPMISGDVQSTQFVQTGMPDSQTIIIDPMTGLPQNVILIQEPSSGPKIIGILIIIWGVLNIVGEVYTIGDTLSGGALFIGLAVISIGISAGYIAGGAMLTNYQQRGVHLSLLMLVITTILSLAFVAFMPDIADSQDFTEEEKEALEDSQGLFQGIAVASIIICGGVCGLIIAIPMMITNNGLDDSSLFGGWF
tara:strand:+ start:68 stop:679 length:612 start_codon:yes stop_codon:yes gene_type:complete